MSERVGSCATATSPTEALPSFWKRGFAPVPFQRASALDVVLSTAPAAFTSVEAGKCNEKAKASVANAKQLHMSLSVCFDGATTKRPAPAEALPSP